MSRSSQESACQRLEALRNRLESIGELGETSPEETSEGIMVSFHKDWQERWLRIVSYLRDLDQMVNRSAPKNCWDPAGPAILQFAPADEGALSPNSA